MCYNVEYIERRGEEYAKRYSHVLGDDYEDEILDFEFPEYHHLNGFTHAQLPVVTPEGIKFFNWGLIPAWVKDEAKASEMQKMTLNAKGETVFEKPSFRSITKKRCLLGVNGFYESHDLNKVKYPYYIRLKENGLFSLGCLYENWLNQATGEVQNTFSIITCPANPLMSKIHNVKNRMPLILDRKDEAKWIDPKLTKQEILELIKPFDQEKMIAWSISKDANNARNNRNYPEIKNEVVYPELN